MDEIVDVEMGPSQAPANTTEILSKWKEKLQEGVLSGSHFKEYWRTWVPKIYSPTMNENCLNWVFNEEGAQRILFNPLEEFIFDGDPSEVLSQLRKNDTRSSVCGRVFKMGEPTYSCRECGMDLTCVLCVDCFKKSEHRFHKYKMGTSGGGGCCDCGDKEAWKKAPCCEIHTVESENEVETSSSLPNELAERTRIVFEAVLTYAYNLLTPEQTADLRLRNHDDDFTQIDTYCTILYNDEVHTFEQVINTLNRVIKCSQRNAIEYVTNVDREGRAVVKCSSFQNCNDLKTEIEKYTSRHGGKPLKVLVVHAHEVAHQVFALKLLQWFQGFLSHAEGFRSIFADVALKPQQSNLSIIKDIMLRDSQVWKSARTHWHRLLIAGMLREYDNKKALAIIFTKNYGNIMKDFIKDDHDHSFSVSSFSVQLFTVPTIAHHLIAYHDVLFILLNTFISECSRKCNKNGKLEFEKNSATTTFRRAFFMLYDLRYLLSVIPETWTDELRRSFLQGLSVLLTLLTMMQGMDLVTRQVGQHMEYEPEWESAFNLHIKLSGCISLALKWCGTDKVVLVKAYRATLRKLYENPCYDPNESLEARELVDHSTSCLVYDVSCKPVSIHQPLTRFLAGLHLHFEKYGLHFDGPSFMLPKPTPIQILEPVLRTQVMIAQVHAGMWRRNGYTILNQLYFYHNVKCRTEMLDRDVQLFQIAASLIESNEFLLHLLNKYNLLSWAQPDHEEKILKNSEEDSVRQLIAIVEEFLQLLINIVSERHVPGISNVTLKDRLKKEIIHQLCIKPLPHSELSKTIPDDFTDDNTLDEVIKELAVFKKPTQSSGRGVYELKEEFYKDYNVFFYHYTREELSKSDETQRKRRKAAGELDCCPPAPLPKLMESFSMIVNLLQSDVMFHIMKTVLSRCLDLKARTYSELQLQKVLHLIGYALLEEESGNYPFLRFCEKSLKWNVVKLMEELLHSPRIDSHKNLLQWTLKKFKLVSCQTLSESPTPENLPSTSAVKQSEEEDEKLRKSILAANKRARVMAQMAALQNQFMKENAKLFEESDITGASDDLNMDTSEKISEQSVCLGFNQTNKFFTERSYTCILCQETQKLSLDGPVLVLAGFVQQATVLCFNRSEETEDLYNQDPLFLNSNRGPAPHTSTCGHVMHANCWQKYFDNVVGKEHRRPYRLRHPASFDVDKQEFLCPLCECLSNTVLPLIPPLASLPTNLVKNKLSFPDWLTCLNTSVNKRTPISDLNNSEQSTAANKAFGENNSEKSSEQENSAQLQVLQFNPNEYVNELGAIATEFSELFPNNQPTLNRELVEMLHLFIQAPYTKGLDVNPHPTDNRLCPMTWKSLAYTLHSIEILLRSANKPLLGNLSSRHHDCLESLIRIAAIMGCTWPQNFAISSHALRLITMIIDNKSQDHSILQWDSIGILVSLTFSMPSLYFQSQPTPIPSGGTLDSHILHLVFMTHIVKLLITYDLEPSMECEDWHETSENMDTNVLHEQSFGVLSVLKIIRKYRKDLDEEQIWTYIKTASLPFLRCCVLFYSFLTDVPAPTNLKESGGDTFSNMCSYLGLPQTPSQLFDSSESHTLISRWIGHAEVIEYVNCDTPSTFNFDLTNINQLVDLPDDYSELINNVSSFVCPNSDHEDSRNPTMCLVCGMILCSQSYCCQTELNKVIVGACNYHAYKCGAGVGIFLRVRECEILFLATPTKGCLVSPPYLDDYGETDQGLRRGNPLHLCKQKYKKLHMQWLNHSIHEDIARAIESSTNILATQWLHL